MQHFTREHLTRIQSEKLRALVREILPANRFYARKFSGASIERIQSPADLTLLPFTTKSELSQDQAAAPPYGTVLTYPPARYSRMHQTSGTLEQPMRWLDTPESWQ